MNKPIKFWKQIIIILFVPFGGIWAFSRVKKLKYGIILSLLPMAFIYLPVIGSVSFGMDENSKDLATLGFVMICGISAVIIVKFWFLYKWTKQHNLSLEDELI